MGKTLEQPLLKKKEDMQKANKHKQRSSVSAVMKEMPKKFTKKKKNHAFLLEYTDKKEQ